MDIPGLPLLVAPARRILAVVTAFDHAEQPDAVIAAHADTSTAAARRHLRNLARLGLVQAGKSDTESYRLGPGPIPLMPAALSYDGHTRATAWHLASTFEAARVLGAAALPRREQIRPEPGRPAPVPANRSRALAWFTAERENLVHELELARELRDDAQAWRLALLMLNINCFAGAWPDWRHVFDLGIRAARRERDAAAQAMLFEYKPGNSSWPTETRSPHETRTPSLSRSARPLATRAPRYAPSMPWE
jgi:hypothetical protein